MTSDDFKSFLHRHGWSAYRFAQVSGIPRQTVYRWAREGIETPHVVLLIRMIDEFGLPD